MLIVKKDTGNCLWKNENTESTESFIFFLFCFESMDTTGGKYTIFNGYTEWLSLKFYEFLNYQQGISSILLEYGKS